MSTDKLDALERLMRLRDADALSEDEFQAEKKALLEKEAANGVIPASSGPSAESTADPLTNVSGSKLSDRANTPIWARKKRSHGLVQVVMLIAALFVATLGGTLWFLNRADQTTYSFMATGPANVRDAPSSTEGRVVGQLADGDFVVGEVEGRGDQQWVKVTEGPLRGRFVWAGNLASEGPDDMLGGTGQAPTQSEAAPAAPLAARSPETQVRAMVADMDCPLLNASVATMICARQVMSAMPNSSVLPAISGNLQVASRELHQRCSAEIANKVDGTAFIVQQQVATVYEQVAPQAVQGGDLSAVILDSCTRRVMGSMAQAGLL